MSDILDTSKQKHHVHIPPVVGRVVHFHLGNPDKGPYPGWGVTPNGSNTYAARIVYVHSPNMVNLAVDDANGVSMGFTSVRLWQAGDAPIPEGWHWCEWMDYQKGQAARTEQLEARIAAERKSSMEQRHYHKPAPDDDHSKPEHWPASGQPPTLNTPYTPGDPAAQRTSAVDTPTRQAFQNAVTEGTTFTDPRHPVRAALEALDNEGNATAAAEAQIVPHAFEGGSPDSISGGGRSIEPDGVGGTGHMPEGNEAT